MRTERKSERKTENKFRGELQRRFLVMKSEYDFRGGMKIEIWKKNLKEELRE